MKRTKRERRFPTPAQQYEAAIHEAGHAVVALHYGFTLRKRNCMVLRNCEEHGEAIGTTYFKVPPGNVIHDAVAGMAGAAAEDINGHRFAKVWDASCGDIEEVQRSLTAVRIGRPGSRSAAAWKEWKRRNAKASNIRADVVMACRQQARSILEDRWVAVTAIARDLAARGRLDRDEVETIYEHGHRMKYVRRCLDCTSPAEPGRSRCAYHRMKHADSARAYRQGRSNYTHVSVEAAP